MKSVSRLLFLILIISLGACGSNSNEPDLEDKYDVTRDLEWANPPGIRLTMDIYVPRTGRTSYPVIIIYHGGGWLIGNKSDMTLMSQYISEHAEYVICNVNYRLLEDNSNTITFNEIIEDAFGALLWIKEKISTYKGDPTRIAVTGDSAGGHLAAMILTSGLRLESDGFSGPSLGFNPTYIPAGITVKDLVQNNGLAVQAAILNYAVFDIYALGLSGLETPNNFFWSLAGASPRGIFGNTVNVVDDPEFYKAVSPIYNIPVSTVRLLPPQLCTVGTTDNIVPPITVQAYVTALENAGQPVEYWTHQGRQHGYLNSQPNAVLGTSFEKDAPPAIDKMIEFLDSIFYP